jgi:hypothetical protein
MHTTLPTFQHFTNETTISMPSYPITPFPNHLPQTLFPQTTFPQTTLPKPTFPKPPFPNPPSQTHLPSKGPTPVQLLLFPLPSLDTHFFNPKSQPIKEGMEVIYQAHSPHCQSPVFVSFYQYHPQSLAHLSPSPRTVRFSRFVPRGFGRLSLRACLAYSCEDPAGRYSDPV